LAPVMKACAILQLAQQLGYMAVRRADGQRDRINHIRAWINLPDNLQFMDWLYLGFLRSSSPM
jgi:hypothetical protein